MKKWIIGLGILIVLAAIGNMMNGTVPGGSSGQALSAEQRAAVAAAHTAHAWFDPASIEARNGVVVANYEVPDDLLIPKRKFAEDRLLAIREALLNDGFSGFRVNVNGPPPGTGLVRRYGSATFFGGRVEWKTP